MRKKTENVDKNNVGQGKLVMVPIEEGKIEVTSQAEIKNTETETRPAKAKKKHFEMIRMKNSLIKKLESDKQTKAIEEGKRKYKEMIKLERQVEEYAELSRKNPLAVVKFKSAEELKEEVKFTSIQDLKMNPNRIQLIQDEFSKLDKTSSLTAVQKQIADFAKLS